MCDNSANVNIFNDKSHYVGELSPVSMDKVATIGRKGHTPSSIGTVQLTWSDDKSKQYIHLVQNVLYFLRLPINILNVTEFARQLNDEEGTGVDTKQNCSKFYWDNYKYLPTIYHPQSNLPEMQINQGFRLSTFYSV